MLRNLLLCALFLVATDLAALEGFLLKPDGKPLVGASVTVVDTPHVTRSDRAGRFLIPGRLSYPITLLVIGPGGEIYPSIGLASPPYAQPLIIRLQATLSESVTVSSGVAPGIEAPPVTAARSLGGEHLQQHQPETITEAISILPGVEASEAGPAAVPSIRGMSRGRTLLLIDGARVMSERRAGASAGFLDPFVVGWVEASRGPGSVVWGSDALGGVVQARLREPELGESEIIYSAGANTGGENRTSWGLGANLDFGNLGALVLLRQRDADEGEDATGRAIPGSFWRDEGALLQLMYPSERFGLTRLGLAIDRGHDLGRPSISRESPTRYPVEESDRLTLGVNREIGGFWSDVEVRAFAGRYRQVLERERDRPEGLLLERSDTESTDASLRVVLHHPSERGALTIGVDTVARLGLRSIAENVLSGNNGAVIDRDREEAIEDARRLTAGLFATWERPVLSWMTVHAGLRGDWVEARNRGGFFGDRSEENGSVAGHLAGSFRLSADLKAGLQVARGFRDPTLSDRYFRGPSGRGFVTGNPELDPERSVQWDGNLTWQRTGWLVALYGYHYQIEDLIERYRSGIDFFFRNRGEGTIRGVELETMVPLSRTVRLQILGNYARGEAEDGSPLDNVPGPSAKALLHWNAGRTTVSLLLSVYGKDEHAGPTEQVRESFEKIDLTLSRRLFREHELTLRLENLGNELHLASADEESALAPGRSVSILLRGRVPIRR